MGVAAFSCDFACRGRAIRGKATPAETEATTAMAEGDDRSWWRRTCLLALVALGGGGILGLGTVALAPALDASNIAGIPNGLFAATLLVPVVILLLIFWSAERQRRIDERCGFFED